MDSGGFPSPRSDCFPAGLRVLVVDDDPTWLKILEKMLKKCNYEVTTCNLARDALNLLRERKDGFDIVISDVNMPDMDGFKLLEHVGLEMDLPVIMMSVDGETSRVMKGVQHGACDYLLKPIRMKELRNIWQHVFRKRIHEVRDIEGHEGLELYDEGYLFSGDSISGRKRKDVDNKHEDRTCDDSSSVKKARVVWTVDLHQKFVKAVNQIGFDKVGPKKILDLMGVPWLTRENVASHLQKYRLYLSRLQKENELKAAFGGIKRSDISPKDPNGNAPFQTINHSSITGQLKTTTSESCGAYKVPLLNDGNGKGLVQMQTSESKKATFGDVIDPPRTSASSINFSHHFLQFDSDTKSKPEIQDQYSWNSNVPLVQLKQEHEPSLESKLRLDHQLPLSMPHISEERSLSTTPFNEEIKNTKPFHRRQGIGETNGIGSTIFSESHLAADDYAFEPIQHSTWNTKSFQSIEQNPFDDLEYSHQNLILGPGSALWLWDEEFNGCSSQGEIFHTPNAYPANAHSFGYNNKEIITDIPSRLYDSLTFDFQYPSDPMEYTVIDQSLYIS